MLLSYRFVLLNAICLILACLCTSPIMAAPSNTTETVIIAPPNIQSGRLGFALLDLQTSQTYGHNSRQRFPMQSVFKSMLAVKVLQEVDAGKLSLDQPVVLTRKDLAMQWSPISKDFRGTSQTYTVKELITRAVGNSDNTAADKLMRMVGGPAVVTEMLQDAGIAGVRVDRYEREFQAELLGLPPFGPGDIIDQEEFETAAKAVSREKQDAAFKRYISGSDPRDSATPLGAVHFLAALNNGKLISPSSTALLLKIMTESPSGAQRIKAGLPPGASFAHKTGTGGDVLGKNAGTNDIGIVTVPDGRQFAIASFLAGSSQPAAEREAIHEAVARKLMGQVTD